MQHDHLVRLQGREMRGHPFTGAPLHRTEGAEASSSPVPLAWALSRPQPRPGLPAHQDTQKTRDHAGAAAG